MKTYETTQRKNIPLTTLHLFNMVHLRRSTRTKGQKSDVESDQEDGQSISTIESDQNTTVNDKATEDQDSEDEEEEVVEELFDESSSSEDEDPEDDDYLDASSRKRKRSDRNGGKRISKKNTPKKQKTNVKKTTLGNSNIPLTEEQQREYLENVREIKRSDLFEALSESDDISIDEYLRGWLENYTTNRDSLLSEFLNFLLDCCGGLIHVEEHDIHNNDSATDTIAEIQLLFEKQKVHEFHLMIGKTNKKSASYPKLYSNFVEFMSKFLDVANDLQLLYVESEEDNTEIIMGPLIVDTLTWLSALSVSKIRCFRYIATLSLYLFQDFLTEHIVDLERNYMAKLTKQLTLERKKKRPNKQAVTKLEDNINEIQNSKIITENIIENIVKICFVHRFKDVDEIIRSDSVLHLSTWINNYPEYFLKVTYLKYFGWLLSDTSNIVRSQVLKVLPNIMSIHSKKIDNAAVRQFFERFRQRILDIALKDVDLEVRLYSINILREVAILGYLEDDEVLAISSLIFNDNDIKVSSHSKNSKFLSSVAKFLAKVTSESCDDFLKNNESLDEDMTPIKSSTLIKVGIIMRFLSNSFLFYIQDASRLDPMEKLHILYQAAEFLSPYFGDQIVTICKLLSDDNTYEKAFRAIEAISKESEHSRLSSQEDNDPDTISYNTTPLLPTNNNNVILYLTVLSGLCYGASSIKNQQKSTVAESILPHLLQLFKNLPVQSSDILPPLLNILVLFSYEDWVQTDSEKSLVEVIKIIIKTVDECVLFTSDANNVYYKALSDTIDHLESFKKSEFDELWINEVFNIKLHLTKFLSKNITISDDNQFIEFTNTLYATYFNKLVLIGKNYPIEFSHDLLVLLFKNFICVLPNYLEDLDDQNLSQINFKLPTLLVSWQLHKWTEISRKSSLLSNKGSADTEGSASNQGITKPNSSIIETLNNLSAILDQLCHVLITINHDNSVGINNIFKVKWELSNSIIDIVVALKCFELQLPSENEHWRILIKEKFPTYLPEDVQSHLKDVFLHLESLYANEQSIQLERVGDEDVTLNEVQSSIYFTAPEKELLIYVLKLKGLQRLGLLNDDITSRLRLNEGKLSSIYQSIMSDEIFEENSSHHISSSANLNRRNTLVNEIPLQSESRASTAELDPLEESSAPSTQAGSRSHNTVDGQLDTIQENSVEETSP